jgi:hypothetical protein
MKSIEIWTNGNRMERYKDSGLELSAFNDYGQKHLKEKFSYDNAAFLSHRMWGAVVGKAYIGTMCGPKSVFIVRVSIIMSVAHFFYKNHISCSIRFYIFWCLL